MSEPAPLTARSGRVKEARRLQRRSVRAERGLFLAEGWKAVQAGGDHVVEVFATPAAATAYADLLGDLPGGSRVHLVEERALASLADTVTPQGLVAVCRTLDRPVPDVVAGATTVAVCAEVRDPGNAGTVIRTADAAGADAVVLAGSSVDAYNPKTVRATVGSLFHLPLAVARTPEAAVSAAREAGLRVLATTGTGEVDLFDAEAQGLLAGPTAWLFGNEAHGLPDELAALADHRVRIPMLGGAESLNLSTAAAVCLYASARARRR